MYAFLNKYGQVAAFGLGLLITVLFILSVTAGVGDFNAMSDEDKLNTGIFNLGLGAAIFLVILCAVAIILFGVFFIVKHPKSSIRNIIPFLALFLVFIIAYAMATPAEGGAMATLAERFSLTDNQEKIISGGLTTALILFAGAGLAFAVSEIRNFFK